MVSRCSVHTLVSRDSGYLNSLLETPSVRAKARKLSQGGKAKKSLYTHLVCFLSQESSLLDKHPVPLKVLFVMFCVFGLVWFYETGFLCVALADLELTL